MQIIKNFFYLTYVRNYGAAFGMLQNKTYFLILSAVLMIALIIVFYHKIPRNLFIRLSVGLILGGALGNLMDRIRLGYVVDFLDFKIWPFVFNIADSSIVIGTILLCYILLFGDSACKHEVR